ncbi:tastin [Varanus komodoensis]|uniref:tastin n=1 Tax=Varanus komodoensis TaxID=61221 RepID=UPI001CF7E32F|nr:tastin [Varanus komodoensis]
MACTGKENLQETFLPGSNAEPRQKESASLAASASGSSKIPVLSKGRSLPRLKPSQQQQGQLPQAYLSGVGSKAIKVAKMPHTGSVPGAALLKAEAGLSLKSLSREPLGEMQLSSSGHWNEGSGPNGKGASTVEFVPDVAALASILSNTGLTNDMVSSTHKPSLARRVPLRGSRACSAGVGTARGTLCTGSLAANHVPMSSISRLTSKGTDQPRSCALTLDPQQLKMLSATFQSLGPGVAVAKPSQVVENLGVGKRKAPVSGPKADSLSSVPEAGIAVHSSSSGRKDTADTSWQGEAFVPDRAAKASILLNIGLSHSALGANGKLSLAQRVPVKDARKPPISSGSTMGENSFPRLSHMSASSAGKFGRLSCRSTQGLKGLEKSEAPGDQLAGTPGDRCSAVDSSPYGLARRVPIACPQSLHRSPWSCNRMPVSSCMGDKRVKRTGGATPKVGPVSAKQESTAVPWEKIAVRLFDDEMAGSVKKAHAAPVIPPGMEKLQRIELLAQLLQKEMNGVLDCDAAPSLEGLHKLLLAHCLPAQESPTPGLPAAPQQDPGSNACELAPVSTAAAAPGSPAMATTSSQLPACPCPSLPSLQPPPCHASRTGQAKQQLRALLGAPQRFHEACLNDECAVYTARIPSATQPPVQRCKEPVAAMLDAQEAMHFIPISAPLSPPLTEGKRSSPSSRPEP